MDPPAGRADMDHMNHAEPYDDTYLKDILSSVKTIAMVGASPDKTKFSYGVLRVLHESGYDMIPINPRPGLEEIRGLKVYPSQEAIDRPDDMVEVFRKSEELPAIAHQAVAIGARVLWAQIGVYNEDAARIAESAGIKVVMNRCLLETKTEPRHLRTGRRGPSAVLAIALRASWSSSGSGSPAIAGMPACAGGLPWPAARPSGRTSPGF